jgi:IS1 family transposase
VWTWVAIDPETKLVASWLVGLRNSEWAKVKVNGKPKRENISTSIVERQNLTMRMGLRRFTRLTNAFSKKVENLEHAISLHFMYYNFVRQHRSLRVSPAMEAGVTDRLWNMEDIVKLIEKKEGKKSN